MYIDPRADVKVCYCTFAVDLFLLETKLMSNQLTYIITTLFFQKLYRQYGQTLGRAIFFFSSFLAYLLTLSVLRTYTFGW
jgi:hypothetical protein